MAKKPKLRLGHVQVFRPPEFRHGIQVDGTAMVAGDLPGTGDIAVTCGPCNGVPVALCRGQRLMLANRHGEYRILNIGTVATRKGDVRVQGEVHSLPDFDCFDDDD